MADLTLITSDNPLADAPRLPALPAPELSVQYLAIIKEILESLLGRRGSDYDRAVTFRDLFGQAGSETALTPAQLEQWLAKSETLRAIKRKIGAVEELAGIADELRAQLALSLSDIARVRQADIRTVEQKIQTETLSLASRLTELTASVEGTAAGIREFDSAYSDNLRAVATRVEQLSATGGNGTAYIEERLEAISDEVDGLQAQYNLKVQTNPTNGQPPVIAGINLSATSPVAGPGTSALIFLAQTIQFLTDAGAVAPFSIVGNQVKVTNLIAEALKVIMPDGTVVLDAGQTLAQQTSVNPNLAPRISSWPYKYGGASVYVDTSQGAINGEYAVLPKSSGYVAFETGVLPIVASEWYTISFTAFTQDTVPSTINVDIFGTNVDSPGLIVSPPANVTKRYSFTEQLPANASLPRLRFYQNDGNTANQRQVLVSDIKIERGKKATAWCDNVITDQSAAAMVRITNLAALSGLFGSIGLGIGGALYAGPATFDSGQGLRIGTDSAGDPFQVMRSASGKFFRVRPSTDTFEANRWTITNPDLQLATRVASITSTPGDSFSHFHGASGAYCGGHTAGISNPVNPSYAWSLNEDAVQANFSLTSTTNAQTVVQVTATGAVAGDEVQCMITCSISDGGTTIVVSKIIYVTFT